MVFQSQWSHATVYVSGVTVKCASMIACRAVASMCVVAN